MLTTNAPAKINLYLHVTGRREDGYHLLDSLVAFTNIGDVVTLEPADRFSFAVEGPMAPALAPEDDEKNLVVRAARTLAAILDRPLDVRLTLTKNLPIASGIGGGSADAAATLRLLAAHWNMAPDAPMLHQVAASLGQDIPCCLASETCFFRGIGDITDPGPTLPYTDILLVNPNVALPTPAVFKARSGPFTPPAPARGDIPQSARELADRLAACTNSLTDAAAGLCPSIRTVLTELERQPGTLLARMSGSGATCFALFEDRASAKQAAATLYAAHPDWWIVPGFLPAEVRTSFRDVK